MSTQPVTRSRRARGSLSEEEILRVAEELVATDGLRQLSLPILAARLGSGVSSVYTYFRNKDALIAALTKRVLLDVHQQLPPTGDGPWDEELYAYFEAFYALLQELPAYREVVAYGASLIDTSSLTKGASRRLDDGLALLTAAGFSDQQAREAFGACLNWTRGFAVLRQDLPARSGRGLVADVNSLSDERFQIGLRLLVAGIRASAH